MYCDNNMEKKIRTLAQNCYSKNMSANERIIFWGIADAADVLSKQKVHIFCVTLIPSLVCEIQIVATWGVCAVLLPSSVFKLLCLNSCRQQLYVVGLLGMQIVLSVHFSINTEDKTYGRWQRVLKPGIIFTVRIIKLLLFCWNTDRGQSVVCRIFQILFRSEI